MKSIKEYKEVPEQLEFAGYVFNEQEYVIACFVFNKFNNINPNTVLQNRGNILGIGDPANHLYCYYSIKNGELLLKFKNCIPVSPIDKDVILELVDKTIILFSNNAPEFRRKNSTEHISESKESVKLQFLVPDSIIKDNVDDYRLIDFFTTEEQQELLKDENKNIDIAEFASVRLRNCLLKAGKNRLFDILVMRKCQLFKLKNFGRKCFEELYDIVKTIANGDLLLPTEHGYNKSIAGILNSDGKYYSYRHLRDIIADYESDLASCNYKKEAFPDESLGRYLCLIKEDLQRDADFLHYLSIDSILSEYNCHKRDYPQLYKDISNELEKLINAFLKEREGKILVSRLGVNCQESTLIEIGQTFNLSRERIRQCEKRAKRGFISKIQRTSFSTYCEIIELKERIISLGLGGFLFALIKFKRENLAKYLMSGFFNDTELKAYQTVKQYYNQIVHS